MKGFADKILLFIVGLSFAAFVFIPQIVTTILWAILIVWLYAYARNPRPLESTLLDEYLGFLLGTWFGGKFLSELHFAGKLLIVASILYAGIKLVRWIRERSLFPLKE